MKKLSEWFLTIFGDIKVFRFPFFLVYDPGSYQVKGDDVRALLRVLQPGDILLRAYTNYLDGKFIPGKFSHAGLYCGAVGEDDRALAGTRQRSRGARDEAQSALFHTGEQMVIHAMAEGVFIEDILTFSRCDQLVVLRLPEHITLPAGAPPSPVDAALLSPEEHSLRERLASGEAIPRAEFAALAIAEALRNVGRGYDFGFDFTDFKRLSCSELVYWCYKAVAELIDVRPRTVKVLFLKRLAIPPDDFLNHQLQRIWASASVHMRYPALGFPPIRRR
ncbi:YiiX/YebB-like N1pC/P60 family cysteine hydrolase [Sphaerotilus sp.]|uniref:YiiX/YebB-like N1pC/P60 family cysteine hydrolase n=1 Tax=Sphaerotilus sp. TaxID=2093942 RepID=UPI002ACE318A|nr:YiiX/YebB-like N1pC/P60 family cysteine hydrolase [Sphaerotilus sp.]MDZ7858418.1 YiiX/YebB-like N1pC/P60 family cysteine hydrolase [Sphaerotilus sp.]